MASTPASPRAPLSSSGSEVVAIVKAGPQAPAKQSLLGAKEAGRVPDSAEAAFVPPPKEVKFTVVITDRDAGDERVCCKSDGEGRGGRGDRRPRCARSQSACAAAALAFSASCFALWAAFAPRSAIAALAAVRLVCSCCAMPIMAAMPSPARSRAAALSTARAAPGCLQGPRPHF